MGKRVYLSPSNQENNQYAIGGSEETYMNRVADVIQAVLVSHGVETYRNIPSMTLQQVVFDSNQVNPDIHAAIHSNSGGGHGCEVFCYKHGSTKGETLANLVYNEVSAITPYKDRGVKQGYNFYGKGQHMYEVAYTNAPAFLVEVAFHDNTEEAQWIVNNINNLGIAIAKGILSYLGITYVAPTPPQTQPQTNVLYRVLCGSYAVRGNAEKKVQQLKTAGFDAVIMTFQK